MSIGPSRSVPELMKVIRHSFRECEFTKVEKILTSREKTVTMELENLVSELDSIKDELRLFKRLAKPECVDKFSMKQYYNKIILELNEKVNALNSEKERLVGRAYQEKCQVLDENEKLKVELTEVKEQNKELAGQLIKALSRVIDQQDRLQGYSTAHQQVDGVKVERLEWHNGSCTEELKAGSGRHATNRGSEFPKWSTSKRKRTVSSDEDDDSDDDSWQQSKRIRKRKSLNQMTRVSKSDFNPSAEKPYHGIYQSIITHDYVQQLRQFAGIPRDYKIIIPSEKDRPNNPPPGFLCFFTHQLNGGLRFPIPPLYSDIARLFNISLSQLIPSSFRNMAGFAMVVSYSGDEVRPTAHLFRSYFRLRCQNDGFFYFGPKEGVQFLKGFPMRNTVWKKSYFFISSPQPSWNFPTVWNEFLPEREKNAIEHEDPAYKKLLERLNKNPYSLDRLVEPHLLYHFGLSPRCKTLLEPLEEIMEKSLMKNEGVPKRRNKNSEQTSSP